VFTVPNLVTVVRLCCLPVFLWLLFGRDQLVAASWLLAGLGATDWVDGYIARRFDQVSEFGKILDPTADRLLFIVGVGGSIVYGGVPLWFGLTVVARELLFGGTMAVLSLFGMKRFDVSRWGKRGTFLLMVSFPLLLVSSDGGGWSWLWRTLGWVAGIPGLVVSYYAAIAYLPIVRQSFREGREEKRS
jgi:cardiolipin synthase